MRIGSLFSGAGGLDMAVAEVFGGEVVWHSEVDKAASKVLAYRFPGVPNLGDITKVDWADVPAVDVLCGGFPCQDVSAAGKRAGIKDGTRSGLWAVFAEAIDALRPQYVVVENVRGLLSATAHRTVEDDEQSGDMESGAAVVGDGAGRPVLRAIGAVLGDLCDLGYDAQWATVAASSVGAPHRRERVFILAADANQVRSEGCGLSNGVGAAQPKSGGSQLSLCAQCGHEQRLHCDWIGRCTKPCECPAWFTPDTSGNGWDEGLAEPARLKRGSDAAVSGDEPGRVELLPTPVVTDAMGARNSTAWRSNPDHGISIGDTLTDAMWKLAAERGEIKLPTGPARGSGDDPGVALLPTPTTQDGANNAGPSQFQRNTLPLNAEVMLLESEGCSHPADARLISDSAISCGVCSCLLSVEDAERSYGTQWGKYAPAIARWEQIVGPAPAPTEPNKNGNPRLSAAFSEWLMGWPAGWVTDPAIGISRNDQLRIVGNGVVPAQAAAALRFLLTVAATA